MSCHATLLRVASSRHLSDLGGHSQCGRCPDRAAPHRGNEGDCVHAVEEPKRGVLASWQPDAAGAWRRQPVRKGRCNADLLQGVCEREDSQRLVQGEYESGDWGVVSEDFMMKLHLQTRVKQWVILPTVVF